MCAASLTVAFQVGAAGARLSGGGFGGSAVLLVERNNVELITAQVTDEYNKSVRATSHI